MGDPDDGDAADVPDGEYVAVVDGVEGERAQVALESEDGGRVGSVSVRRDLLPRRGARPGGVFTVTLVGGALTTVEYEHAETMRRRSARNADADDG